jgi:hypothetical protein
MNELDVLKELMDDDPFIRAYPSFNSYISDWDELIDSDEEVPEQIVFEFYAEKTPIPEALSIWYAYKEHL